MFAVPEPNCENLMELEKVLRILALALVVIAFAVKTATRLMFPDAGHRGDFPITICLVLCLIAVFGATSRRHEKKQ